MKNFIVSINTVLRYGQDVTSTIDDTWDKMHCIAKRIWPERLA